MEDAKELEKDEPLPASGDEGVLNIVLTIVMALLFIGPADQNGRYGRHRVRVVVCIANRGLFCIVFLPKLLNPFLAPIFLDFAKVIHGRLAKQLRSILFVQILDLGGCVLHQVMAMSGVCQVT